MRILLIMIVAAFVVDLYTFWLSRNGVNSNWVYYIYLPVEYTLVSLAFSKWQKASIAEKALLFSIPVFIIVNVLVILSLRNLTDLNSLTLSLSCMLYVCISSYTLFSLQKADTGLLYKDFRFWVCSALLLYSAGCLAFFAFSKIIVSFALYYTFLVVNIIAYILYGAGFLCHIRR